jgi:hypothetical protein
MVDYTLQPNAYQQQLNDPYGFRMYRQMAAGAAMALPDVALGLPALFGNEGAGAMHQSVNNAVNATLNADDPYWRNDPAGFVARQAGAAFVGLPARAFGAVYKLAQNAPAAVQYGLRGLEAVTPLTIPLNPANIAINTVGGSLIGGGVQELGATENAARVGELPEISPDTPVTAQRNAAPVQEISPNTLMQVQQEISPDTPLSNRPIPPQADNAPRTTAGKVLEYAPWVVGALAGVAGTRAVLQARNAARAAQADTGEFVKPGITPAEGVERLTPREQFQQQYVSSATGAYKFLDEAVDAGAMTRDDAARGRGYVNTQIFESSRGDTVNEIFRTGYDPVSGKQATRSLEDFQNELAVVRERTPESFVRAQDAIVAATEKDARDANLARGNWDPNNPGEPARVTLHDRSYIDLDNAIAKANADPIAAQIIATHRAMNDEMLSVMVASGLKTVQDVVKMKAENPNFSHMMLAKEGVDASSPFTRRNYEHLSGTLRAQDPFIAMQEAMRIVYSVALENQAKRAFADVALPAMLKMQQANPNAPSLIQGMKVKTSDPTPKGWDTITYRRNGIEESMIVAPSVARAMESVPRATVPLFTGMARAFRNTTTGPLAAIFGSIQAPVSAAMGAMSAAVTRPTGSSAGIIDNYLLRKTGKGLKEYTGFADPTFLANVGYAAIVDTMSETSRVVAQTLRRSDLRNGVIAKSLGQTKLNAIMQSAQKAYDTSILAEQRRLGSASTGLSRNIEETKALAPNQMAVSQDYRTFAQRRDTNGALDAISEAASTYGARLMPTTVRRTWDFYTTVLDIVSSAPASAFVRQNVNNMGSPKAVHGMARRLTGDPAEIGASPTLQQVTSVLPYSNISIQSTYAIFRAIRENPIAATSALASAIVLPQAIQLASAILADNWNQANGKEPEHVMALVNRTGAGQANDIRISIPGVPPENGMRIVSDLAFPIPPLSALINNMLIAMVVGDKGSYWTPKMEAVRNNFTDFMTDRSIGGIGAGAASAGLAISPPPLLTYFGKSAIGSDTSNMLDLTNPRISTPRDLGAPGYTKTRNFEDPVNRHVRDIMESLFSVTGENLLELYSTFTQAAKVPNASPTGATAEQYVLGFANTMRMAPPLLQPTRQLPQRDAVGEVLAGKEEGLRTIANGIADATRPGTVGSGRGLDAPYGIGRPAPHPEMLPIVLEMNIINNRAIAPLQNQRKSLQDQLVSMDSDPRWRAAPIAAREERNKVVQQIRDINRQVYGIIEDQEKRISERVGFAVDISKINPQRGLDQFRVRPTQQAVSR